MTAGAELSRAPLCTCPALLPRPLRAEASPSHSFPNSGGWQICSMSPADWNGLARRRSQEGARWKGKPHVTSDGGRGPAKGIKESGAPRIWASPGRTGSPCSPSGFHFPQGMTLASAPPFG